MTSKIKNLVTNELAKADRWFSVADLFTITSYNPQTIARILRADPTLYKSERIPGDTHCRKQWALQTSVTAGWAPGKPPVRSASGFKRLRQKQANINFNQLYGSPSAPTLNTRNTTMCLPTNKPSLITAATATVALMMASNKRFSAHDVTKELRDQAMQPVTTISPAETGTVFVQGKSVPNVMHDDVRNIVHELFEQNLMSGYGRTMENGHWVYDLIANIAGPNATPAPATTPATNDGSSYDGSSTI